MPDSFVWQEVLTWLRQTSAVKPDGEYELKARDIYAVIQTATPQERGQSVFEAHREYIDLHYCLAGGEIIEHAPAGRLAVKTPYRREADVELYKMPAAGTTESVCLQPGQFAVFFPGEAHMPKIFDGTNREIRKAVVKVRLSLL